MSSPLRPVKISTRHGNVSIVDGGGSGGDGGPAVLFIHGNSSCKEVFRHQFTPELRSGNRLIAMDLPGHGASDNAADAAEFESAYTIPGYAEAALDVLAAIREDAAVVVGWSLGGHVALEMADPDSAAHLPGLRGMLITGTPPVAMAPEALGEGFLPTEHMGLSGQEVFSEEEVLAYVRATCGTDSEPEPFLVEAVRRTDGQARVRMIGAAVSGIGADGRKVAETSPVPLAIVQGGSDPFVNGDYLRSLAYANLWENTVHVLDGVGHAPFHEAPETFNPYMQRFLESIKEV